MQFVNNDIQKAVLSSMQKDPPTGDATNFFEPMNEMDPLVKNKKKDVPIPKFNFKVFYVAGPNVDPMHAIEYIQVMNMIVEGKYELINEQTYNSKEGDISILVRWLELPGAKAVTKAVEEQLDAFIEDHENVIPEKKKRGKKAKKAGSAPTPDSDADDYAELPSL